MTIEVSTTNQAIEVSTSGQTVTANVSGGEGPVGPQGPQGPSGTTDYNELENVPSSFTPAAHAATHGAAGSDPITVAQSQVTGLGTALDGKAAASHTHAASDITSGTIADARLPADLVREVDGVVVADEFQVNAPAYEDPSIVKVLSVYYDGDQAAAINADGSFYGTWAGNAIPVANGGTGATDASTARTNLEAAAETHASQHFTAGADPIAPGDIGAATADHTHGPLLADGTLDGFSPGSPLIVDIDNEIGEGSFGTTAGTFCEGDDSRLSDSRTPTGSAGGDLAGTYPNPTLASSGATAGTYRSVTVNAKGLVTAGTNPTTLAGYGITDAAASSHSHAAGDITSGTIATARLGSGTASSSTFLRGDQTYADVSAANVSGLAASATTDTTNATNITSGTLAAARIASHASTHNPGGSDAATLCETYLFTRSSKPASASGSSGSYTWSVPAAAKYIMIDATGPGGGGGSGRRGAAGSVRGGGGGGGSGGRTIYEFPVSELGANLGLTITVGPGGAGGAAVNANDTNGNAGSAGTVTSDASVTSTGLILARGWAGTGGGAGTTSGGSGGSAAWTSTYSGIGGGSGGGSTPTGGTPGFGTQGAQGGGGGGGISAADVAGAGGAGYSREVSRNLTGSPAGGTAGGGAGGAGIASAPGGSGGGGSGGGASTTTAAGAGGNGGSYGGGGGGGGASLNGFASGAGGNGGDGVVRITIWY